MDEDVCISAALIDLERVRALPVGGTVRIARDARVTPDAGREALRRGIRLLRGSLPRDPETQAGPEPTDLARYIDHTLLAADAGARQIDALCDEARVHGFAAVCVHGCWVARCAERLADSPVVVCSVVAFPLGAMAPAAKVAEAAGCVADGAREVDVVLNLGALRSGDHALVRADLTGVAEVCHAGGALLKVILETALLTREEQVLACQLALEAGSDYVKTSTGFGPGGASVEDVALLRACVGPDWGVKASGGIRDAVQAWAMIAAGATRLGTSASVAMVESSRV